MLQYPSSKLMRTPCSKAVWGTTRAPFKIRFVFCPRPDPKRPKKGKPSSNQDRKCTCCFPEFEKHTFPRKIQCARQSARGLVCPSHLDFRCCTHCDIPGATLKHFKASVFGRATPTFGYLTTQWRRTASTKSELLLPYGYTHRLVPLAVITLCP